MTAPGSISIESLCARLTVSRPVEHPSIYVQIGRQIAQDVRRGRLTVGSRLPSVRQLARALGVNPKTIVAAYRLLKKMKLIVAFERVGTFVAPKATDDTQIEGPYQRFPRGNPVRRLARHVAVTAPTDDPEGVFNCFTRIAVAVRTLLLLTGGDASAQQLLQLAIQNGREGYRQRQRTAASMQTFYRNA